VLLDAGCLCCANTGALQETLADLGRAGRARGEIPPFERVIIETSGAADPAPLLNVLLGHPLVTGAYAFEATVCAIDAQHFLARAPSIRSSTSRSRSRSASTSPSATWRSAAGLDFLKDAEILETPAELFSTVARAQEIPGLIPAARSARARIFPGIRAHASARRRR
jgi:G3E family GTPase